MIDLDIRFFRRYPFETNITCNISGKTAKARTVDYSLIGVGLVADPSLSLKAGDVMDMEIRELDICQKGKVQWIVRDNKILRAGILKVGPLTGSLKYYSITDILIGFQRTLKTGILDIRYESVSKQVYFKNGNIIYAASNLDKDRIGDILLKSRRLTKEQFATAADIKLKTGRHYPAILVEQGFISPAELFSALKLQLQRILKSIIILQEGEFRFTEGPLPAKDIIKLKLSASNLIYRELRKKADINLIKKYLLNNIVKFSSNPLDLFQNISLNRVDREILALVDGKTAIKDIIKISRHPQESSLKSIYALLEARILEIMNKGQEPQEISHEDVLSKSKEPPIEMVYKIERMHFKYSRMNYYEILGLDYSSNPSQDEIKKAYYSAAREYHPDLHFSLPKDMKKKLIEIFIYITNAYLTLMDSDNRKNYDRQFLPKQTVNKNRPAGFNEASEAPVYYNFSLFNNAKAAKNTEIAISKFREGKSKFKEGRHNEAAHLFAMAVYFDNSIPEFHYYYGSALAMLGNLKESVKHLNRALELKPFDSDILAELGHVYYKLKFPLRAEGYFKKALKFNPSNKRASDGIKMLKM